MMLSKSLAHSWKGKSVLVTGCTGLLGSWITHRLVAEGAAVVGLIRDTVPGSHLFESDTAQRMASVRGDVRDQALVERVLQEYEVEVVLHLAAQALVGVANRSPAETLDVNIKGTWSVLEAARRAPAVKAIVVASSDKAYGASAHLPYTEDTPLRGRHPYDVSKSCADLIAQCFAHTYDLPVGITRCGNLFGGGDLNWNRIVPGTMRSVLEGKAPLIRSDGTLTRDYLYIEDAVNAYLQFAAALIENPALKGQAFNFGHNHPLQVIELVHTILQVCAREDLEPIVLSEASNEIKDQYLDSARSQKELGWTPQFSLQEGLKSTLGWYQKYFSME